MGSGIERLENLKKEIENGLFNCERFINSKKQTGSDITFISELFIEELLNEIYLNDGFHFVNMNFKETNFPAIDLADEKNGISYQITVTNDPSGIKKKVEDTLNSFYKRNLHQKYKKLFIIIASGIQDKKRLPDLKCVPIDGEPIDTKLFCKRNILDLVDLGKIIISKNSNLSLERINEIIHRIHARPERKIIELDFNNYIERTVLDGKMNKSNLVDIIAKNNRILLLGEGGIGKTTEIDCIQSLWSKKDDWYCFRVDLNDYTGDLDRFIDGHKGSYNWKNTPISMKILMIFDGLDEINKLEYGKVVNEIKAFSDHYPEIYLIVSCRNNEQIYTAKLIDDAGFKVSKITPLTDNQVFTYLKSRVQNFNEVKSQLKKTKLIDVLKNPFYLIRGTEIFALSEFPNTKFELLEALISHRFKKEKEKEGSILMLIDENEYNIEKRTRYLALLMLYAGINNISNLEFQEIIRDEKTRDGEKRLFLLRSINHSWHFEHKIFQDFYAAKYFKDEKTEFTELFLNKNIRIGTHSSEFIELLAELKQKEKWHFESIVSNGIKNRMISETYLPEDYNENQRKDRFLELFQKHQNEQILIWRKSYDFLDLAKYVNLNENNILIQFLLNELIDSKNSREVIANTVLLLAEVEIQNPFIPDIRKSFLPLLKDNKNNIYIINHTIIKSFSKWELFDSNTKLELIQNENLFSEELVSSLCSYLREGEFLDISAELTFKLLNSLEHSRVGFAEYQFYEIVEFLSNVEIIKLIYKLIPSEVDDKQRYWIRDLFKIINKKAIECYRMNPEIAQAITDFIYASFDFHDGEPPKHFKSFFEETNVVQKYFRENFLNDLMKPLPKYYRFSLPALIADNQCLDWVVDQYSTNPFDDNIMWDFLVSLDHVGNHEGRQYFAQKIRTLTNDRFEPKRSPYDIFNKEKDELWFKILLDQKLAIQYINKGFDALGKDDISKADLNLLRIENKNKFDVDLLASITILRNYSDKQINKKEYISRFSDLNYWDEFVISEYSRLIVQNIIPEANQNWIIKWCKRNHSKVQFKGAITEHENGEYRYKTLTKEFIQFALLIDFPFSQKHLLEMTTLIGVWDIYSNTVRNTQGYRLYDFIKKKLNHEELRAQILKNLDTDILVSQSLREHVEIIGEEKIVEGLKFFPKYIADPKIPKYIRSQMLRMYKDSSEDPNALIPALNSLTFIGPENYFDWEVIDYLITNDVPEINNFLIKLIASEDIDKFTLGIYLIKAKQYEGFNIVILNLKLNNTSSRNDLLAITIMELSVEHFNESELKQFLFNVFEIHIKGNLFQPTYHDLLSILSEKFFELIIYIKFDSGVLFADIKKNPL